MKNQSQSIQYLRELVKAHDGVPKLAVALKVSRTTVYSWLAGKKKIRVAHENAIQELHQQIKQMAAYTAVPHDVEASGLYAVRVFQGTEDEALVICQPAKDVPHGALVVCNGVLGHYTKAVNADINLVTSVENGAILHLDGLPNHIVLGKLVPY